MISNMSCMILEIMDFKYLIDRLARHFGLEREEFLSKVGLSSWAYHKWKDGNYPSTPNLKRMELEYGFRFIFNEYGEPVDFKLNANGTAPEERKIKTPSAPKSAREEYENLEFYGGKVEWIDLPDDVRAYFEDLFKRMEMKIDEAYSECTHRVDQAVSEFRRLIKDKVLGI